MGNYWRYGSYVCRELGDHAFFGEKKDPPNRETENKEVDQQEADEIAPIACGNVYAHTQPCWEYKPENKHQWNQYAEGAEKRDDGGESDGRDACPITGAEKTSGHQDAQQSGGGNNAEDWKEIVVRKFGRQVRLDRDGEEREEKDVNKTEQKNGAGGDADGRGQ